MTASLHAGDKVAAILRHPGCLLSQRELAKQAFISEPTLRNRIMDGDFRVRELERIVAVLGVDGATVLPDSLTTIATPRKRAST